MTLAERVRKARRMVDLKATMAKDSVCCFEDPNVARKNVEKKYIRLIDLMIRMWRMSDLDSKERLR